MFSYARYSAKLFKALIQHRKSNGILAIVPANLADSKPRGEDRTATMIEVLELLRPDLQMQNLDLCFLVVDAIADDKHLWTRHSWSWTTGSGIEGSFAYGVSQW